MNVQNGQLFILYLITFRFVFGLHQLLKEISDSLAA